MDTTELRVPSSLRATGVICGLAAITMLVGVPAGAAPADAPQLSIAIDDGHTSTAAGDTLDTAITVRNLGTTEVTGLTVTQTMPAGLIFGSADADGVAGRDGISWTVDLAPVAEVVVRSTMTVSETPPDLLRLATVACAGAAADGPPIVCAADSDQLPAGAAAEAAVAAEESAAAATVQLRWYLLVGGVVLVVAVVAVLLMRRRRMLHIGRTTTVVALLAVVATGTWSSSRPPVATPADATPAVAATVDGANPPTDVAVAAAVDAAAPVGGPAGPATAPAQPEPGMRLAGFTAALPSERAAVAVKAAMMQIGLPYVWGGNGPHAGDAGFDCSGLTTFAYATAGVPLPRTAHTQYYAGPHLAEGTSLRPGDLVFYGTPARVHHVGMFIGQGRMVNAPTFGKPVQTSYYRWPGDDFLGSTRPAATGQPTAGLSPYYPPPTYDDTSAAPAAPPVFLAPPAPPLPEPLLPATATLPETGVLAEPVPLPGTVPPVPTDPGLSAAATAPGTLPATPAPDPGVVPAPDVTVAPGPTTTPPTTTPPTTTPPSTEPARPALVLPAPVGPTTAAPPTDGPAPSQSPTTAPKSPAQP